MFDFQCVCRGFSVLFWLVWNLWSKAEKLTMGRAIRSNENALKKIGFLNGVPHKLFQKYAIVLVGGFFWNRSLRNFRKFWFNPKNGYWSNQSILTKAFPIQLAIGKVRSSGTFDRDLFISHICRRLSHTNCVYLCFMPPIHNTHKHVLVYSFSSQLNVIIRIFTVRLNIRNPSCLTTHHTYLLKCAANQTVW